MLQKRNHLGVRRRANLLNPSPNAPKKPRQKEILKRNPHEVRRRVNQLSADLRKLKRQKTR